MSTSMKFRDLEKAEDVFAYLHEKQFNHTFYSHYSSLENIDKILYSGYIWLTAFDAEQNNDRAEAERSKGQDKYHLCMSAVYSENIPMWYFYGGIDGQGARLDFPKRIFRAWVGDEKGSNLKLRILKRNGSGWEEDTELSNNSDVKIQAGDVLYVTEGTTEGRIKHNNCVKNHLDLAACKEIKSKMPDFCKDLGWFYEKEFRIVAQVMDEQKKQLLQKQDYRLAAKIDETLYKDLNLLLGPESTPEKANGLEGIERFKAAKLPVSEYAGRIRMDIKSRMCSGCVEKCDKKKDGSCKESVQK